MTEVWRRWKEKKSSELLLLFHIYRAETSRFKDSWLELTFIGKNCKNMNGKLVGSQYHGIIIQVVHEVESEIHSPRKKFLYRIIVRIEYVGQYVKLHSGLILKNLYRFKTSWIWEKTVKRIT